MELFDLRQYDTDEVLQQVLDKGTTHYQLTYNDRALQFFRTFVEATEKANYFELPPADASGICHRKYAVILPANGCGKGCGL